MVKRANLNGGLYKMLDFNTVKGGLSSLTLIHPAQERYGA